MPIALFADVIPQEARDLGTMGSQAILAVGLIAVAAALVYVFKLGRQDVATLQERNEKKEKEMRAEFSAAMKDHSEAIRQISAESKANTAAILSRLDRLEMHLPDGR